MRPNLGRFGVWARPAHFSVDLARELEAAGYGAIWLGRSPGGDLDVVDELLAATDTLVVATGIVNIWKSDAVTIARAHHRITAAFPGRFLLGVGVGHPENTSDYQHPYRNLVAYLDVLDAEGVPQEERALAALGPKVLALARDRSAGAHPYLTQPEHTRQARELLGAGVLLAPEQKIVIETDPDKARNLGRRVVAKPYLELTNYLTNLRHFGWADDDFANGGSDELIDALVGHGDAPTAATRVQEHLDAGADHVTVQLITDEGVDPIDHYRQLAEALKS
jgi:probable F420-dependent oxidoreductase